jgi:hypothetical protein
MVSVSGERSHPGLESGPCSGVEAIKTKFGPWRVIVAPAYYISLHNTATYLSPGAVSYYVFSTFHHPET